MPVTGKLVTFLGVAAMSAAAGIHAQDSSDMIRCSGIDDANARLACYDEVAGRNSEPDDEPAPLTQEIGEEQLAGKGADKGEPTVVRGRVTRCEKDASNKWYFTFDNAQVWKQRSGRTRSFRDCDFQVLITKDSFGYKMQIEGENGWIRIGRVH